MSAFLDWFTRSRATVAPPWLGVHAGESCLLGAARVGALGARPRIQLLSPAPVPPQSPSLRAWKAGLGRRVRANVVLRAAEYRVLPVEPPDVAPEELRDAVRWQMADVLDFPAEDAAFDLLTLPSQQQGTGSRGRHFMVAAPGEHVTAWVERCKLADLPLGALDIPEMAMRNLSVLAAGEVAHAYLHVGILSTRMALIWKRELCSFRQLDVSARQLAVADESERQQLIERLALEIQRTADAFSRQFSGVELEALWLTSVFEPQWLADGLAAQVPQRVRPFDLREHIDIDNGPENLVDLVQGRDYTLAIGAALREESA